MNRTWMILASGGLGVVGCSHSAWTVWETREQDLSFPVQDARALSVRTYNGEIEVVAEETGDAIHVHVTKRGGGPTAESASRAVEAMEVRSGMEGTTRHVEWEWNRPREGGWQGVASFRIHLPRRVALTAHTYNGDVTLTGLSADARLTTHNGAARVTEHDGPLTIETYNGAIDVQSISTSDLSLVTHNGSVTCRLTRGGALNGSIKTYNGRIALDLGPEVSTQLTCETHNGRIRFEREMKVSSGSSKELQATLGAGEGRLTVETYNGSIDLR